MVNWISSMFGENMPPAVGVIAMFALAILAIGLLLWIARRILGGTFVAGGRARQLRLAVMDATPVDSRRRLVLVRRDDVEHLILIGGPTDVVVEQNIRLSPAPSVKQQNMQGSPDSPSAKTKTEEEPKFSEPVKMPEPTLPKPAMPSVGVAERPVMPSRPAQPAPVRPATIAPRPMETPRMAPPPVPPVPPRPVSVYAPPSSGPAAGLSGLSYQPRPAATPVAPTVPATKPESGSSPSVELIADQEPKIAPTMKAPAILAPLAGSLLAAESQPLIEDNDDSMLLDLSEEIDRVAGAESDSPDISLEEEMESLLADLDVKAERAT